MPKLTICLVVLALATTVQASTGPYTPLYTRVDPSPDTNDLYATDVDISDRYLLVGNAGFDQRTAPNPGRGSVFVYDVASGDLLHELPGPPLSPDDFFRNRVAIDGDYLLVGSPSGRRDVNEPVHLYDAVSGALLHTFGRPDGRNDYFASEIAICGNYVLIASEAGSPSNEGLIPGEVLLFDALSGNLLHTFGAPASLDEGYIGFADHIAIEGDRIAIAAPYADFGQAGEVLIYDATSGDLVDSFRDSSIAGYNSLAIREGQVLVGHSHGPTAGVVDGQAFLFNYSGELLQTFNDSNPVADFLGMKVAFAGDRVVASYSAGGVGNLLLGSGAALFDIASGDLVAEFLDVIPGGEVYSISNAVSPNNAYVAIGGFVGAGNDAVGRVVVFNLAVPEPSTFCLALLVIGSAGGWGRRRQP